MIGGSEVLFICHGMSCNGLGGARSEGRHRERLPCVSKIASKDSLADILRRSEGRCSAPSGTGSTGSPSPRPYKRSRKGRLTHGGGKKAEVLKEL